MNGTYQKILMISSIGLIVAGAIFLCLSLFGYEKMWTLPIALGCIVLSMMFQIIFRQRSK